MTLFPLRRCAVVLGVLLAGAASAPAWSATITVTSTLDSGPHAPAGVV